MNDLISRLSEIRSNYNCFDETEEPYYRALSEAIQLASAQSECKPPIFVAEDRFIKNMFAVFPHCPKCNAEIVTGQCYCSICGQHIDWSEEDG